MPHPVKLLAGLALPALLCATEPTLESFKRDIQPVLDQYCYDCHGFGHKEGGVNLEDFEDNHALQDRKLWLRVLKNVRAGIMPPAGESRLPQADWDKLLTWIKRDAFGLDPTKPDPGRVTVRRLNRVEYRNTIHALLGVDFDAEKEFPADDTGQGFDNIADVLSISPLLMEKYLDAAQAIVNRTVPSLPLVPAEATIPGKRFTTVRVEAPPFLSPPAETTPRADSPTPTPAGVFKRPVPTVQGSALDLCYYTPATVQTEIEAKFDGKYQLALSLHAIEAYVDDQFDLNRCKLTVRIDGEAVLTQDFVRESDKGFDFTFDRAWKKGAHVVSLELQPLGPDQEQKRLLRLRLNHVTLKGPLDAAHWVPPPHYATFFPRPVPAQPEARRAYAQEILRTFASKAFRRPVDHITLERLVSMSQDVAAQPGNTFEAGVAQAMVGILASPRFLFRDEDVEPLKPGQLNPNVDEYSLASRLSYFFWSSMPDEELFGLAKAGKLREQLPQQIARLLADPKGKEFIRNFTGQWLQARDIENVQINPFAIFLRENPDPAIEQAQKDFLRINRIAEDKRTPEEVARFAEARKAFIGMVRKPKPQLTEALRTAMRAESEMVFDYVIKEDRSLVELIESNYTFLNEDLAKHYGIPGVTGKEMRKVVLPPDSPRGGVLTQGTVLAVTSNPTRTSPVKRGVFVLDNILGTRPPAPPPNVPSLEDAASPEKLKTMTLRENLALHASNKLCASCHSRMDPLGLALENFNALGVWRDAELNRPIDPAGKLITGETFAEVRQLKHILATEHRRDFYYCITQKLLTYALGRALDYYDTETVDQLVAKLEASDGKPSSLLYAIVASAPFQQRRNEPLANQDKDGANRSATNETTPARGHPL